MRLIINGFFSRQTARELHFICSICFGHPLGILFFSILLSQKYVLCRVEAVNSLSGIKSKMLYFRSFSKTCLYFYYYYFLVVVVVVGGGGGLCMFLCVCFLLLLQFNFVFSVIFAVAFIVCQVPSYLVGWFQYSYLHILVSPLRYDA
jgi:hypothetical protein